MRILEEADAGRPSVAGVREPPADSAPRARTDERPLPGNGWLLLLDLPALSAGMILSLWVARRWFGSEGLAPVSQLPAWPFVLLLIPLSAALAAVFGLYRPGILRARAHQFTGGARVLVWSAAVSVGGIFLLSEEISATLRGLVLLYHGALAVWLIGARPVLAAALRPRAVAGEGRILIFGSGRQAVDVGKGLTERGGPGTRILSFLDDRAPELRGLMPFSFADLSSLPEIASRLRADVVVVARSDIPRDEIIRLSDDLVQRGVRVKVLSEVLDRLFGSIPVETVHGRHLMQVGRTPLCGGARIRKRLLDVAGALLGGLAILPLLASIALAIRLTSRGPILYRQPRIGRGGRPFTMFKFRSMIVHEEDEDHHRYLERFLRSGAAAGIDIRGRPVYKRVDDPRITAVGHILRRTSLDELPQLWNVLRGEMSLVGPRPCLPFEYDLYEDWQRRRLDVTPGMTGLWQVTGRSCVTFEEMVLLDLFYIGNWSFALDMRLLFRTVPVILFGKGGL